MNKKTVGRQAFDSCSQHYHIKITKIIFILIWGLISSVEYFDIIFNFNDITGIERLQRKS